jgi:MSHA biogenesis protein MshO
MAMLVSPRAVQRGFTLIELVMVIVLLGVIGGVVAVFMKKPIDAYFDSARRAALSDVADTVLRRVSRDIQKALPNSLRSAADQCVEFIPTKTGGRYRADAGGAGDVLDFSLAAGDSSFNMLGRNADLPAAEQIAAADLIVIYNLGISGADAYAGDNTAAVTAASAEAGSPAETIVTIQAKRFPLASPGRRFQVIPGAEQVVRYVCIGATGSSAQGQGLGSLYRQVLSLPLAESSTCPATAPAGAALMANHLSACHINYSGSDLQRNALVSLSLQLTDGGETVSLQHEVHVSNAP